MCGIVGAFTSDVKTFKSPAIDFFRNAIFADTIRGWDSTGVALLDRKMKQPEIFKKAVAGPDFLELRQVKKLLNDSNPWTFMLGHNRAATRGAVEHDTAHPFQYGNITLVHNGTVTNHRMLTEGHKFTVDSEAICNAINLDGIAAVVGRLQGAFTLVWHDASDDSLNIVRNDERPLWVGVVDDLETLLICSEGAMLQWLGHRSGYKFKQLFQPAVGVHYKYYVDSGKDWANQPVTEKLALAPKSYTGYSAGGTATTTTTTNNRYSGQATLTANTLKSLGVEVSADGNHVVVFRPEIFTPNATNKNEGRVVGSLVGVENDHDVVVYGAQESVWRPLLEKVVLASVQSAYTPASGAAQIIIDRNKNVAGYDTEVEAIGEKKLLGKDYPERSGGGSDGSSGGKNKSKSDGDDPATKGLYKGHGRSYFSAATMENLIKHGCANCTSDLFLDEVNDIYWKDATTPICKDCAPLFLVH